MEIYRIDEDTKQDLRLFGYYLFNGTIDLRILDEVNNIYYVDYFKEHPMLFGEACCVFVNNLKRNNTKVHERTAKWIRKNIQSEYDVEFEDWEIDFTINDGSYYSSFKKMVLEISQENFVPELLYGNYFSKMVDCYASFLETCFAIWSNVIELDSSGNVLNLSYSEYRTAQWIKLWVENEYKIVPPLEEWEVELY